jgi:hypothetical protein
MNAIQYLLRADNLSCPGDDGDRDDLVDGADAVPAVAGIRDRLVAGERDGDPLPAAGRGYQLGGADAGSRRLRGANEQPGFPGAGGAVGDCRGNQPGDEGRWVGEKKSTDCADFADY